ncbi:MAG: aminomethyltransferase family protein [Alphaproteobacteria bacterium]|nr:aminomethyltransferase family protein [Alphaproteobacteria bacterium]MBV9694710.1 aminomethyltransferase family protein [Alphaproteobacteria bacterium]
MSLQVRATPFHGPAAAASRLNLWEPREGWTVAAVYEDAAQEALAARLTVAMADISWRWRVAVDGARAEEFLARLLTRDPASLAPGEAFKALWLSDGGALRGAGLLARNGRDSFMLVSACADPLWIARAAALFDVKVHEIAEAEGMLAVVGPYAARLLAAAGLDPDLAQLRFRKLFWRGIEVTLSRFGEHEGFEIACSATDAPLVWDRLAKVGRAYALEPAGMRAMDILDMEAGVPRPGRDYRPARGGFDSMPAPEDIGLGSLVDPDHVGFNGRSARAGLPASRVRMGIVFDSDVPAANAVIAEGGRTLSSVYSPALRSAIALAMLEPRLGTPNTQVRLADGTPGLVTALPFLPPPVPLPR